MTQLGKNIHDATKAAYTATFEYVPRPSTFKNKCQKFFNKRSSINFFKKFICKAYMKIKLRLSIHKELSI